MSGIRQPEVVVTENTASTVEKLFINGDDKNVAATVIYTSNKTKFTYDAAGKIEVPAEDMVGLFIKGVVCVYNNTYYKPTACTKAGVITFAFPS